MHLIWGRCWQILAASYNQIVMVKTTNLCQGVTLRYMIIQFVFKIQHVDLQDQGVCHHNKLPANIFIQTIPVQKILFFPKLLWGWFRKKKDTVQTVYNRQQLFTAQTGRVIKPKNSSTFRHSKKYTRLFRQCSIILKGGQNGV